MSEPHGGSSVRFSLFVFSLCFLMSASASYATEATKTKVEELFIWKMSDELSLIPGEEKKFTEIVKKLNQKKSDLNADMQNLMLSMQKAKTDAEKNKELSKYKKSLQAYSRLAEEEIDTIKNLLGIQRTVKYLEVKQDMTNRLKNLLANPEPATKKVTPPLPPPKIIEE